MPSRLEVIRTRQAEINTNLTDLQLLEDPSEDDQLRMDALIEEFDGMETEAKPLQSRADKITEIREEFRRNAGSSESGSDDGGEGNSSEDAGFSRSNRSPELMRRVNPFDDLDGVRSGLISPPQVRSRAEAAVEQFNKRQDVWGLSNDGAEEVTRKIRKLGEKFGTAFSRQIITTGAPEYLKAFEQYLNDPSGYQGRAAMSLTAANGGFLVPFTLDPTIILTNAGSANPYRRMATVKTTTTNDWNGVTSAGVSAEWTAEGIEAADASPTVGQLKITPQKADAYLFGSYEVLGDSDFASQLPGLLSDAKDRLEEAAFAIGTGTGQPFGLITRATAFAGAVGTAASGPTAASVYGLIGALPARWRGPTARLAWLSNLTAINTLRNTPKFTGATESIVLDGPDGVGGFESRMLGIPYLESTSVVGAYANGNRVLALADMSQYYIVDRVGMSVVYDPLVLGANRRPSGQGAWYAFWRVGADISVATAARALTLTT